MKSLIISKNLSIALFLGLSLSLAVACGSSAPEELVIPVKLEGGKLNPETIQVGQGDTVTLQVEAQDPGGIHIHGYDLEVELDGEDATNFVFVADATGRFRITFHPEEPEHGSHEEGSDEHADEEEVEVGFLEVRPR